VPDQVKTLSTGLLTVALQVGAILNADNLVAINTYQVMMMAKVGGKLINRPGWQRNPMNQTDITQQVQITIHSIYADGRQFPAHSAVYFPDGQTAARPAQNLNNLLPLGR
jgi:hypothetical protein